MRLYTEVPAGGVSQKMTDNRQIGKRNMLWPWRATALRGHDEQSPEAERDKRFEEKLGSIQ